MKNDMKEIKIKLGKALPKFLLVAVTLFVYSSCEEPDLLDPKENAISPKTVAELAADNTALSTLSAALVSVKLDSVLSGSTTFTLFAPSNSAFEGLDLSAISEDSLTNILLNHVRSTVSAEFTSTMETGYTTSMATGPDGSNLSIFTEAGDDAVLVNGAIIDLEASDLGGTNGVVHVIDKVLLPSTLADQISVNPEYSSLRQALARAELTGTLENGSQVYTVFAPTNSAFEKFLMDVNGAFGWSTLEDIPIETLEDVLLMHVVGDENLLSGDVNETSPTTLQGASISIDNNQISDATPTTSGIVLTDVQAANGVMHGVDKVLLPDGVYQSILSATLDLVQRLENRGFTDFARAVEMVGSTASLSADEITAFVPNNDAFVALFATIDNFGSLDEFQSEAQLAALKQLVDYHLYTGSLMASGLVDGATITTVNGDDITIDLGGDDPRLHPSIPDAIPSTIVTANIGSSNGVIHEINRVLVPEALAGALGIELGGGLGLHPVGDPELVFFDWNGKDPWWGNVVVENDASISLDGGSYGRANFQTGGTGWQDLFWRNGGSMNGAEVVGTNLDDYSLKFDINVLEPISEGMFRIRFNNSSTVDAFYDWAPWNDTGEAYDTDGWITVEIPLSVLGQPDFSGVDNEFGMAFEGADVLLNFAIDNVRFDSPGNGGPEPVADEELVFFDWNGKDPWWGNVAVENDAAISLDGGGYGRANFQTGGTGWQDLFWRNGGSMNGADVVGTNVDDYVLKFDINTIEPLSAGMFRIRFNNTNSGVDSFYDWAPWNDSGDPLETNGWTTITIPLSLMSQTDYTGLDQEFGMAFEGADVLLNFAIDNVRFEEK